MYRHGIFFWFLLSLFLTGQTQENSTHHTPTLSDDCTTTDSKPGIFITEVDGKSSSETSFQRAGNTNPLIVEISTGRIEGRELITVDLNNTYYAFQGIPYATPPVGDLRFREPLPAEKWNGTLLTVEDGRNCIQDISAGSEDCLYLNVFSPKHGNLVLGNELNELERKLLPVMVWIYGGAFVWGSSQIETFGPDYFLDEDVIIVSFNYRVGVFGFLSTEDFAATGNWGLKDQILALKWVQENIEQFGGNPQDVTVFGESAGSACVSILTQSLLSRGLFHKAIMQSGTNLNLWSRARHPRKSAYAIATLLDIRANDTNDLVTQLRKVDARTLQVVSVSTDLGETIFHNPLNGLVFAPTIEVYHPGAVLINSSHTNLKNGDFNRIPVIVGFDSQESINGVGVLQFIKPYVATYDLFSTRLVPASLNIGNQFQKVVVAQLIRMRYFGMVPIILSNNRIIQYVTDDQFVRPIYEYVRQSSKYAPTYFYVFGYEGPLGVDGKNRVGSGVGHAEENNYFWNKETTIGNPPVEDLLTRKRLLRLWTNFAKTGNPTPVADELLQNVIWPSANIKAMVYLNITANLELDTNVEKYSISFWDEIFLRFGVAPYETY